jgi:hypothetical protein
MAFVNPNKPAGLSPLRYWRAAKYDGKVGSYAIKASNTSAFYPGDLVTLATGGSAQGLPYLALATAGSGNAVGVVVAVGLLPYGPFINPNNLAVTARPAAAQATDWFAAVSDDPDIVYEIQEGGAGTNLTPTTALTKNANILYAAPGTGVAVSGTTLNNASVTTSNGAATDLKIIRFVQRVDNQFVTTPATGGGAQKWEVMLNGNFYRLIPTGTAGI